MHIPGEPVREESMVIRVGPRQSREQSSHGSVAVRHTVKAGG